MAIERKHYSYFAIAVVVCVAVVMLHNLTRKHQQINELTKLCKQTKEEKITTTDKLEECNKKIGKSTLNVEAVKKDLLNLQEEYDTIQKKLANKNRDVDK